jgi:hypothetical protein
MKRQVFIPIAIAAIALAFGIVCFLLWLRRGKSPGLLHAKLRLGGAILTLSAMVAGTMALNSCVEMCYAPPPPSPTPTPRLIMCYAPPPPSPSPTLIPTPNTSPLVKPQTKDLET